MALLNLYTFQACLWKKMSDVFSGVIQNVFSNMYILLSLLTPLSTDYHDNSDSRFHSTWSIAFHVCLEVI